MLSGGDKCDPSGHFQMQPRHNHLPRAVTIPELSTPLGPLNSRRLKCLVQCKHDQVDACRGETLARLSRAFAPPEGTTFLRGEVAAIRNWRREDGDAEYNHPFRRDEWEVVLPELVFEAGAHAVTAD